MARDGDLFIGSEHCFPNNEYFNGYIDEVRVYNRCLSAQEVRDLFELCGNSCVPYVCKIGLSTSPFGDQDVTTFYSDETLYVRYEDVNMTYAPNNTRVRVFIVHPKNANGQKFFYLERSDDGSYTGSTPLSAFGTGWFAISISTEADRPVKLRRTAWIQVLPAP